jgi:hypothetical protein
MTEPPALKFSHQVHQAAPGGCAACHPADSGSPGSLWPRAEACDGCHAERMEVRGCDSCHPAGPDGRLKLQGPGGKLLPGGGHGGEDHGPGWGREHAVARSRERQCQACHDPASCERCHQGVQRAYRIHPADWELSHPGEARRGTQDCGACHRSQSGCLSCHRNAGVAESAARPRNRRLHPEGYGEAAHAADARMNLRACASCHAEADCIRCHGAKGPGAGFSPHPASFRSRCALMRSRNERPCLKCHLPADLEARCP